MEVIIVAGLVVLVACAGTVAGVLIGVYGDRAWSKWRRK